MRCIVCQTDPARYRCRHCKSAYCSSNCFKVHREWSVEHDEEVQAGKDIGSLPEPSVLSCEFVQRSRRKPEVSTKTLSSSSGGGADDTANDKESEKASEDLFSDAVHDGLKRRRREAQTHPAPAAAPTTSSTPPAPADDAPLAENGDAHQATRQDGNAIDDDNADEVDGEGQLCMLRERHLSALANNPRLRNALKTRELQRMIRTIDSSRSRLDALETAMFNHPEFAKFCAEVKAAIASAQGRSA